MARRSQATGAELKRRGMKRAAENPDRSGYLEAAREAAWASIELLDLDPPEVSMNEVWLTLCFWGFDIKTYRGWLGNAAGSVFKGNDGGGWKFTGRRVHADYPDDHMNELKIWKPK